MDHAAFRDVAKRGATRLFPIVFLYGFLTSGTMGRYSCNTWPKVGENWFYSKNHLRSDIPKWRNYIENGLVV